MLALGVMLSGSGTNLQALIDAIEKGELDAQIKLVVSSNKEAYGLVRAQNAGIKTLALDKSEYQNADAADEKIATAMSESGVELIAMAGYMRIVGPKLLEAFPNKIINLHPALLPSFPGAHGIKDAFDHGVKVTGITIHIADGGMDTGPIIAQRAVVIEEGDTLETLEEKIHQEEHILYPKVVQLFAQNRVHLDSNNKVSIS